MNSTTNYLSPVSQLLSGLLLCINFSANAQPASKPILTDLPEIAWTIPPTAEKLIQQTDQGYVAVIKKTGDWTGPMTYGLFKFDQEGKVISENSIATQKGQHLLGLFKLKNSLFLISDQPSPFGENRYLIAQELNSDRTGLNPVQLLDSSSPGNIPLKGQVGLVKEAFKFEVAGFLAFGGVPGPETRFEVIVSENEEYLATHHVNWSTGGAEFHVKLFDAKLNSTLENDVPVVPGYLHFEFKLSNWGDLFGVSGDEKGNLIVEKYGKETVPILLSAASSFRSDPLLCIKDKDRVIVVSVNLFKDQLFGLQIQELDFANEELLETSFYKIEAELEKQLKLKSEEQGLNQYRLSQLQINEKGEVFALISQHWLRIPNAFYDRYGARRKKLADFKSADVFAGPMLLMSFAADLQPRWHYIVPRTYSGKCEEGLLFHGSVFRNLNQPEIDFTFYIPAGDPPVKGFVKNIRIDRYSGLKKREETIFSSSEGGLLSPMSYIKGNKGLFMMRNAWRSKSHKMVSLSLP